MQVIILPTSPIANKHSPCNLSSLPWYIGEDKDENFKGYVLYINNAAWKKTAALLFIVSGSIQLPNWLINNYHAKTLRSTRYAS